MLPNARAYADNSILSAPPEKLLLLLLDGAITCADRGARALEQGRSQDATRALVQGQEIASELLHAQGREVGEETYRNIVMLYAFVIERFTRAAAERNPALAREAHSLLTGLREMWGAAVSAMHPGKPVESLNQQV